MLLQRVLYVHVMNHIIIISDPSKTIFLNNQKGFLIVMSIVLVQTKDSLTEQSNGPVREMFPANNDIRDCIAEHITGIHRQPDCVGLLQGDTILCYIQMLNNTLVPF